MENGGGGEGLESLKSAKKRTQNARVLQQDCGKWNLKDTLVLVPKQNWNPCVLVQSCSLGPPMDQESRSPGRPDSKMDTF